MLARRESAAIEGGEDEKLEMRVDN